MSRIQHIVGDLLDLSREREGTGICVERTPTDLRAMCQNVADDVKAIAIRMVLPRNMPAP